MYMYVYMYRQYFPFVSAILVNCIPFLPHLVLSLIIPLSAVVNVASIWNIGDYLTSEMLELSNYPTILGIIKLARHGIFKGY